MRIPLDYYRILGVPTQVTDEQLTQAYQDRSLQLPRREYSEAAIAARRQLLNRAYEILSNPEKRALYDQQAWGNRQSSDEESQQDSLISQTETELESSQASLNPEIEVNIEQLTGGLLIYQELGEYELVIKFAGAYLPQPPAIITDKIDASLRVRSDILLSLALAYLELSREQWQHREYEQAARSGEQGLELLRKEALFPKIMGEINTELNKLRPYRILELLAKPLECDRERQKGIDLLKAMLQERQGIDGKGNDRSGLAIDDFLRFIQQIRTYLTVKEQQELFGAEAQRPSAVAAYLEVYTLIARGFVNKQPSQLIEAQIILKRLSKHQDISLEQAICALFLGQTQTATQALECVHDEKLLEMIREQSQGAPDLLPGLCAYAEQWLKNEVFSHFRDLTTQNYSLEDYFADKAVQTFLEQLSVEVTQKITAQTSQVKDTAAATQSNRVWQPKTARATRRIPASRYQSSPVLASAGGGVATLATPVLADLPLSWFGGAVEGSQPSNSDRYLVTTAYRQPPLNPPTQERAATPPRQHPPRRKSRRAAKRKPWLLGLAAIATLGLTGISLKWLQQSSSPLASLEREQLLLQLDQPPIAIPVANAGVVAVAGSLTEAGAKQVIEAWLANKSQAFGSKHQIESLKTILAEPLLLLWQDRASTLKKSQDYWQYQHQVEVTSLAQVPNNANRVSVEALVKETADFYQKGQLNPSRSYNDRLKVRYELVHQGDRWLIENIQVLK